MNLVWSGTFWKQPWAVYEFPWGTAVRYEPTGEWTNVYINRGDGTVDEIDIMGMGLTPCPNGLFIPPKGAEHE